MTVTVYSKPGCVQCTATTRALDGRAIPYEVIDLTADPEAMTFIVSLGYRQAPVVVAEIFSGDGDFRALVEAIQRRGVRVTVVSTTRTSPPMIADDLRRQADQFVDLDGLRSIIGRAPRADTR